MPAADARPVPRKNAAFRFYFAIRKNDGTLITTWAGQDSEVSLDGAAFSDCTNEATEIGTSGTGYLDLTASEMNADCVVLKITVTNTDALPLVFTLFPEEAGDYRADVTHFGGTAGTFASGRPEVNTTHAAGTAWGSGAITAASIASSAITSAKFSSGAITSAVLAGGAITAGTFASGAISAGAIAASALDDKGNWLKPTVAGRTLDVSATGEAGIDWANIGSPTTSQNLSGTTISVSQAVASVSGAVGSVTGNVGGNVIGSVASVVGGVTVSTNSDKTGYSLATAPLDAAGTRAALGLASANLDTQLAAIVADTNELQTDWANGGRLDLILDTIDLWTKRSAVLNTGTLTGAGTNTEVYTISALGITATCTTDSSGNRSAIVWS